jgi:hypothetical protein
MKGSMQIAQKLRCTPSEQRGSIFYFLSTGWYEKLITGIKDDGVVPCIPFD